MLAVSNPQLDGTPILTAGDAGFAYEAARHFGGWEGAGELIALKRALRQTKGDEFWSVATRGIAGMLGAQYAFVSKRHDNPALGCLTGMSIYFSDGESETEQQKTEYSASNSPCGYMKDKVLLIPERLSELVPKDPNNVHKQPEAYLGVPLCVADASGEDRYFAHFGAMWTARGLEKKALSFETAELLLHGISDLILDAFIERGLACRILPKPKMPSGRTTQKSLKPFAKNLSHELRTPMQGVVGMLDIMLGTVQDACEEQMSSSSRSVLNSIKRDIEIVQGMTIVVDDIADSSRQCSPCRRGRRQCRARLRHEYGRAPCRRFGSGRRGVAPAPRPRGHHTTPQGTQTDEVIR
jgi:hypothetical protein